MRNDSPTCRIFCSDKIVNDETEIPQKPIIHTPLPAEQCIIISNQYYANGGTLIYHVPQKDFTVESIIGNNNDSNLRIKESTKCEECGIWFNLGSTLRLHNTIVHNGGKGFHCDVCSKVFTQKQIFEAHRLSHTEEKLFKCTICSRGFKRLANMKRHAMTHGQEKDFFCEFCGKGFYFKESLKKHHTTHNRERPYQCRDCNYLCKTLFELDAHKKVHTEEKNDKTDVSMNDVLNKTKDNSADDKVANYQCLICKEKFFDKHTLNDHYMEHTGSVENNISNVDNKKDSITVGVIKSIRYREVELSKQGSSIPVECESCKQIFRTANELKEHERIHTSDNILKTCLDMKNEVINLLPTLL